MGDANGESVDRDDSFEMAWLAVSWVIRQQMQHSSTWQQVIAYGCYLETLLIGPKGHAVCRGGRRYLDGDRQRREDQ